jgi:hypothetical protein
MLILVLAETQLMLSKSGRVAWAYGAQYLLVLWVLGFDIAN